MVKPKDHVILVKKLEKLILDKKLREYFSENSRVLALKEYNIDRFVKANIKEYQRI